MEVNHAAEIDEIFDAISYRKGASVIRMLQSYLGAEVFQVLLMPSSSAMRIAAFIFLNYACKIWGFLFSLYLMSPNLLTLLVWLS